MTKWLTVCAWVGMRPATPRRVSLNTVSALNHLLEPLRLTSRTTPSKNFRRCPSRNTCVSLHSGATSGVTKTGASIAFIQTSCVAEITHTHCGIFRASFGECLSHLSEIGHSVSTWTGSRTNILAKQQLRDDSVRCTRAADSRQDGSSLSG